MDGPSVIVVGAGTVGASCAWRLQRDGARVTLVDSQLPGQATSFGNAGCISKTSVFPFSVPGVLRKLPGWLRDPEGPVRIPARQLVHVAPWLFRFWRAGTPARVAEIVAAQSALMAPVLDDFGEILAATDSEDLRRSGGMVLLYETRREFDADAWKFAERDRLGLAWRLLDREELADMEPSVRLPGDGVALHEPLWHWTTDPGGLTRRFADAAIALGARWVHDRAIGAERRPGTVSVTTAGGESLRADRLVLASGPWTNALLAPLGWKVPMLPKRGYHAMFARPSVTVNHPIMSATRHVLLTPMKDGLRISGTAEFARLDAPPDYARARALVKNARRFVPEAGGEGLSEWMGQRPMMPDSIPVLGPLPGQEEVLCAFGHGHYGLTQGPTTGRIVSNLVFGRDPGLDLAPFSISRF